MPGERELSRQLNVSRPTLRAALDELRREGLLKSSPGCQREIVRRPGSRSLTRSRAIGLLTPLPLQELPPFSLCWMDKLRELLGAAGYKLEIHSGRRWYARRPEKDLAALTQQTPSAAWMLFVASERMQRWFAGNGQPCVVSGSCHPGVELPSLDVDYRAVCRHAAGQLIARGHRRVALMMQGSNMAGDRESEIGFREAFPTRGHGETGPIVAEHDGTPDGIRKCLDELLRRRPAPTGFLVARSMPLLAVASELTRRGLRLPKDAALIGRDSDHFLEYFSPVLARYHRDPDLHARRLARMILQLARGGVTPPRQIRLMPEFLKGESVG